MTKKSTLSNDSEYVSINWHRCVSLFDWHDTFEYLLRRHTIEEASDPVALLMAHQHEDEYSEVAEAYLQCTGCRATCKSALDLLLQPMTEEELFALPEAEPVTGHLTVPGLVHKHVDQKEWKKVLDSLGDSAQNQIKVEMGKVDYLHLPEAVSSQIIAMRGQFNNVSLALISNCPECSRELAYAIGIPIRRPEPSVPSEPVFPMFPILARRLLPQAQVYIPQVHMSSDGQVLPIVDEETGWQLQLTVEEGVDTDPIQVNMNYPKTLVLNLVVPQQNLDKIQGRRLAVSFSSVAKTRVTWLGNVADDERVMIALERAISGAYHREVIGITNLNLTKVEDQETLRQLVSQWEILDTKDEQAVSNTVPIEMASVDCQKHSFTFSNFIERFSVVPPIRQSAWFGFADE